MAVSSAVEVYTILQRHLDTLRIISIMYLKRQSAASRLKISLLRTVNLTQVPLMATQEGAAPIRRGTKIAKGGTFTWRHQSQAAAVEVSLAGVSDESLPFGWSGLPASV